MTEQLGFSLVATNPEFELRHYAAHSLVQVDVAGSFDRASSLGFGPLIRYISGANLSSTTIPMTAPVFQQSTAEERYTVSFVMPADMDPADVPTPRDTEVRVVAVAEFDAAVRPFRGAWRESTFRENGDALLAAVAAAGLEPMGTVSFARFDPPWKPGFLKRNEAMVSIARP